MKRLPTKAEAEALCGLKKQWDAKKGILRVQGNGKTINLQAEGRRLKNVLGKGQQGHYWTITERKDYDAHVIIFNGAGLCTVGYHEKTDACSVRLVSDEPAPGFVDLGLSVYWAADNEAGLWPYDEACEYFIATESTEEGDESAETSNTNADGTHWDDNGTEEANEAPETEEEEQEQTKEEEAMKETNIHEEVNATRPNYYKLGNGIECKDVVGEMMYNIGTAMAYLWRAGKKHEAGMSDKDKTIQDLQKAIMHIEFEIERRRVSR